MEGGSVEEGHENSKVRDSLVRIEGRGAIGKRRRG